MFDIGFSEIVLVFIVGLLVLGPEKMPQAIRSVAKAIKTVKDMAKNVQNELDQELKVHEIQEQIKKVKGLDVESFLPEAADELKKVKQSTQEITQDLNKNVQEIKDSINAEIDFDQDHEDEDLHGNSEKIEKSVAIKDENAEKITKTIDNSKTESNS